MSDEVPAKEIAQQALANRIYHEPDFLQRLVNDPTATAKPVLQKLLGADSPLDLTNVRIEVHFETEDVIHLVIPVESSEPEPELDEVSGFEMPPPLRFGTMTSRDLGTGYSDSHGCYACPHNCTGPGFSGLSTRPQF